MLYDQLRVAQFGQGVERGPQLRFVGEVEADAAQFRAVPVVARGRFEGDRPAELIGCDDGFVGRAHRQGGVDADAVDVQEIGDSTLGGGGAGGRGVYRRGHREHSDWSGAELGVFDGAAERLHGAVRGGVGREGAQFRRHRTVEGQHRCQHRLAGSPGGLNNSVDLSAAHVHGWDDDRQDRVGVFGRPLDGLPVLVGGGAVPQHFGLRA